ncbi:Imm57 family immunity protein [Paraburkholderia sp. J67]|uniref:Imm57 family immunity protein n=1 Tax=Paraburkholderia sp. J67 TaxID=2805435 RepID=UPI002ABD3F06|nr:Imm57 family immunity protein [Paraburkholderia sp. J67]
MNYVNIPIRVIVYIILGSISFISSAKVVREPNRDEREIAMAESALFWSRVATVSEYGRRACETNELACSDDRAELGLALIGGKKSIASIHALVFASRYRMDGALSENYVCYILSKGRIIYSELKFMNTTNLEKKCLSEFDARKKSNQRLFDGVPSNQICSSSKEISELRTALIQGLESGERCNDGDF